MASFTLGSPLNYLTKVAGTTDPLLKLEGLHITYLCTIDDLKIEWERSKVRLLSLFGA